MSRSALSAVSACTRGMTPFEELLALAGLGQVGLRRQLVGRPVAVEHVGGEHDVAPVGDPLGHLRDARAQPDGVHEEQHARGAHGCRSGADGRRRPRPLHRRASGSRSCARAPPSRCRFRSGPSGPPTRRRRTARRRSSRRPRSPARVRSRRGRGSRPRPRTTARVPAQDRCRRGRRRRRCAARARWRRRTGSRRGAGGRAPSRRGTPTRRPSRSPPSSGCPRAR